jgi:hypothetical protein
MKILFTLAVLPLITGCGNQVFFDNVGNYRCTDKEFKAVQRDYALCIKSATAKYACHVYARRANCVDIRIAPDNDY